MWEKQYSSIRAPPNETFPNSTEELVSNQANVEALNQLNTNPETNGVLIMEQIANFRNTFKKLHIMFEQFNVT